MFRLLTFIFAFCFFMLPNTMFGQVQLGGGLTFGTGISKLGFNVRGTYEVQEKLLIAPGINFFFKDKFLSDASASYFSVDLDGRYNLIHIAAGEGLTVYPVAGVNFFNVKVSGSTTGVRVRDNGLTVGLNLGLGTQIATLSDWSYFGEFRTTVGGINQSTITAGVLYGF